MQAGQRSKIMPLGFITIPREHYEAILHELRVVAQASRDGGPLYKRLRALAVRLPPPLVDLGLALEACEGIARQITEIDGHLRVFDLEMTPVRPPSYDDIRAAYENSAAYENTAVERARDRKPPLPRKR